MPASIPDDDSDVVIKKEEVADNIEQCKSLILRIFVRKDNVDLPTRENNLQIMQRSAFRFLFPHHKRDENKNIYTVITDFCEFLGA